MRPLLTLAACLLATAIPFAAAQPPAPQRPHSATTAQPAGEPLDINKASPQQLDALPGFGPVYTRRVIAGRPYSAKNQLVTRGIIPRGEYDRIASLIVAHRAAR